MAKRLVYSSGKNIERSHSEINEDAGDNVKEGKDSDGLAKKFYEDKEKLEDEIDKVSNSSLASEDKIKILNQLKEAVVKLQEQYEEDVETEQKRVQEELKSNIDEMESAINELQEQSDSLRGVTMDAAATDASAAADEADAKKLEFEKMRDKYTDDLRENKEQAEEMRNKIMSRRH